MDLIDLNDIEFVPAVIANWSELELFERLKQGGYQSQIHGWVIFE